MRHPTPLLKLPLMALLCLAGLGVIGACASQGPRSSAGQQQDQTGKTVAMRPSWPKTTVAQRDFVVDQILYDDQAKPWKLWLISAPHQGQREAVEFFTGESVKNIKDVVAGTYLSSSRTDEASTYRFADANGRRFDSKYARVWNVETDSPQVYAGWEARKGPGHSVSLGGYLFKGISDQNENQADAASTAPIDPSTFFSGARSCDEVAYVARTMSERYDGYYRAEKGFFERAKLLADFDTERQCWNTRPYQALDLGDNTFVFASKTRVFRINGYDLTPAGSAPDLRVIDVKEK
jgi:hypothetical protein